MIKYKPPRYGWFTLYIKDINGTGAGDVLVNLVHVLVTVLLFKLKFINKQNIIMFI